MVVVTDYKGAKIGHVFRGPVVRSTVAVDKNLKLIYEGPFCVDHLTNSYKYNEEMQIITYQTNEPEAEFRVKKHNGYYRLEVHIPMSVWNAMFEAWKNYVGDV